MNDENIELEIRDIVKRHTLSPIPLQKHLKDQRNWMDGVELLYQINDEDLDEIIKDVVRAQKTWLKRPVDN